MSDRAITLRGKIVHEFDSDQSYGMAVAEYLVATGAREYLADLDVLAYDEDSGKLGRRMSWVLPEQCTIQDEAYRIWKYDGRVSYVRDETPKQPALHTADFYDMTEDAFLAECAGYAFELTNRIAAHYGKRWQPVMRNKMQSCAYPALNTIHYGWASLRYAIYEGFEEYASIWTAAWDDRRIVRGKEAAHRLVLHECAHLLQASWSRGSIHNESFVIALRKLRTLFPY